MTEKTAELDEMIDRLQSGEVNPGSHEGQEAIRQLAKVSPSDVARKLYLLPNDVLEKGMRRAGMSDDDIEDVLRTDDEDGPKPENPFDKAGELRPEPESASEASPFEYDPSAEMANGPRRR